MTQEPPHHRCAQRVTLSLACWLFVAATVSRSANAQPTVRPTLPSDRTQIDQWVADLDADVYVLRKQAMDRLISQGGNDVVESIAVALRRGGSVELQIRAFRILSKIAIAGEATEESVAYQALCDLGESEQNGTGRRALVTLQEVNEIYRVRAAQKLNELGAELDQRPIMNQFALGGQIEFQLSYTIGERWKGKPADLRLLRYFDSLQIRLDGENITDEYMAPLTQLKTLRRINITNSQVTDTGLAVLPQLPQLEELRIFYTPITDKSVETFSKILRLNRMFLIGTGMTPETIDKLQHDRPGIRIDFRIGGFLGVGPKLGVDIRKGCMINRPQPNSAAERAGLLDGDVIVKYDGVEVDDFDALRDLISHNAAKDRVEIEIKRGSEQATKAVELGAWTYEAYGAMP